MSEPSGIEQPQDLMGYPSVEALVNAKRASDIEAQRIKARADAAEQQLQAVIAANQRPAQPAHNAYDPTSELETLGIPTRALDAYVENKVQSRIAEAFQPLRNGFEARGRFLARNPDYAKHEPDVHAFINSDPQTSQTFNEISAANPLAALEYAFAKYGEHKRSNGTPPNVALPEPPTHAALPTSRGDTRRSETQEDAIRAARERYMQTGSKQDAYAYAKAKLRAVVSDEHLNS